MASTTQVPVRARLRWPWPSRWFALLPLLVLGILRPADAAGPGMTPTVDTSRVKVRQVWADSRTNSLGMPSPDGRFLSYVDWETGDLAVRDLLTGKNTRLTRNATGEGVRQYAYFSTISPDSRQVAYAWFNEDESYDLRVIDIPRQKMPILSGGFRSPVVRDVSSASHSGHITRPDRAANPEPRILYRSDQVQFIKPASWSNDGKYILALFFGKSILNQIVLVSVEDGSVQILKTPFWIYPKRMSLSPDGRFVVYGLNQEPPYLQRDIFVLPTDGSPETTIVKHPANDLFPMWAPDGRSILFASDRDGTLDAWVQPVDGADPLGPPIKVKTDIGRMMPLGFSNDGTFFYALRTGDEDAYLAGFDSKKGKLIGSREHASERYRNVNRSPDWSADGEKLAFLTHVGTENQGLEFRVVSVRSLETGEERQLDTPRLSYLNWVRWAPDGQSLLVGGSDTDNNGGLYRIDAEDGTVSPLIRGPFAPPRGYLAVWAPDGKGIYYVHEDLRETTTSLRFRNLETGDESKLYSVVAPWRISNLARSPDGESLAFGISQGNRTDAETLLVMPAAGGAPREVLKLKTPRVSGVTWSRDGGRLLFSKAASPKPQMCELTLDSGKLRNLNIETNTGASIAIHPSGNRIAYTAGKTNLEIWAMENSLPDWRSAR